MPDQSQTMESLLPRFTETEMETLVALPYRIGLYVSYADTTGGWEAQEAEIQSLSTILRAFAEDLDQDSFAQKILMESLVRRGQWPGWSHHVEKVPEEAMRAVLMIEKTLFRKDLHDFKDVLMQIALTIATAYREADVPQTGEDRQKQPSFAGILARFLGGGHESALAHVNISGNERTALTRLADALNFEIK